MSDIKIAYFGHPGSFSHTAARQFIEKRNFKHPFLYPCQSFQEVIDYVLVGKCYGVLPYYNTTAGNVLEGGEMIKKYSDLIIDDIAVPVHHYLMGLKNSKTINNITSHPQALKQCKNFLSEHFPDAEIRSYSTTSTAAYDLSNGNLSKDSAVIGSKEAAEIYNLKILASNIEDNPDNITHFKVFFVI